MPGVCARHVLYTDTDVIFANPLTHVDLEATIARISEPESAFVAYGPEAHQNDGAFNTGVMFIDTYRFVKAFPAMLAFGISEKFRFPAYDQGWMNAFFTLTENEGGRTSLGPLWNWKVYWPPVSPSTIKVIHFHGPKPGNGLEYIAYPDKFKLADAEDQMGHPHYLPLIEMSLRNNASTRAAAALDFFHELLPPREDFC
jgi:hypothetical protein